MAAVAIRTLFSLTIDTPFPAEHCALKTATPCMYKVELLLFTVISSCGLGWRRVLKWLSPSDQELEKGNGHRIRWTSRGRVRMEKFLRLREIRPDKVKEWMWRPLADNGWYLYLSHMGNRSRKALGLIGNYDERFEQLEEQYFCTQGLLFYTGSTVDHSVWRFKRYMMAWVNYCQKPRIAGGDYLCTPWASRKAMWPFCFGSSRALFRVKFFYDLYKAEERSLRWQIGD